MDLWMMMLVRRVRYWCNFTSIKVSIVTLRLKLSLMQIDLSILIALKKLLTGLLEKLEGKES